MATVDPALLGQATGAVNNLTGIAGQVTGAARPNIGPMPTALFDRYKNLLMDPSQINNDPAFQQMQQQALQASQRQLAAGRMSKSGNAAIEAAKIGAGTTNQFLSDLAQRYGAGAGMEASRWGTEAGVQSNQFRDLLAQFQLGGDQYGDAARLYAGQAGLQPGTAAGAAPIAGNPYSAFGGDYRAGMTPDQLAGAMRNRLIGGVPGYQTSLLTY